MARLDPDRAPQSGRFIDTVTLGSRRRRRRMTKLLAELDRRDREAALRVPQKPAGHRLGSALVALLLLAGAGGVVYIATHRRKPHPPPASHGSAAVINTDNAVRTVNLAHLHGQTPSPGVGERATRLLPAVKAPEGTGGYTLEPVIAQTHERWDPCRPIHYVVRDQATPAGGDAEITQAVAAISQATGLKFIYDGTTSETPNPKRPAYEPARYGNRWAPLIIAWTNPTEIPELAGRIIGLGGSIGLSAGNGPALVSGEVWLDTAGIVSAQAQEPNKPIVLSVIEHELGHVVGLGHVQDPTQIMYPDDMGVGSYGAGDLRGLAYAGSGACHPEL